ncbi:DUF5017 domain-containing protein [Flavobacterium sp.]|uniref:DUF5017 domain-containing protein n=1 Tax=Flavobacterium sp. TaxID=239 RepID=UPI0039E26A81
MKNYLKSTLVALLFAGVFTGCSEDDDTALPETAYATYSEDFGTVSESGDYSFDLDTWTVFAEAGTKNWFINDFDDNVYLEFSSFNSGNASNIGWLVSPAINIDNAKLKRLIFQSAQHHATSLDNKFELLVSTNYDGENVLTADWETKTFRLPKYIGYGGKNYEFANSGVVDLSQYSGEIYIAFRVKGNSTTQTGGFQVDNIKIF